MSVFRARYSQLSSSRRLALDLALPSPNAHIVKNSTHVVLGAEGRFACDQEDLGAGRIVCERNGAISAMGFFLISLYFVLSGLVGTLGVKLCYNKGASTNMLNVVLVNTAVICCWLMWAIVWLAQWKPLINPVLKAEGE